MAQPITMIQVVDAYRNSLLETSELKQQVALLTLQVAELTGRLVEVENHISPEPSVEPVPEAAPEQAAQTADDLLFEQRRALYQAKKYRRTQLSVEKVCEDILAGRRKSPTKSVPWTARSKHFPSARLPTAILSLFTEEKPFVSLYDMAVALPDDGWRVARDFVRELEKQDLLIRVS